MLSKHLIKSGSIVLGVIVSSAAFSQAPASGDVAEGLSAPGGLYLGDSRSTVANIYGAPNYCSNVGIDNDQGSCQFSTTDGGQVSVVYEGSDGGYPVNSSSDVVSRITWYETTPGWVTEAGVNTELVENDPQQVAQLYPNATVYYHSSLPGNVTSIIDYEAGIGVYRTIFTNSSDGRYHPSMAIFNPTAAPTPPPVDSGTGKGKKGKGGGDADDGGSTGGGKGKKNRR